jgi:hypothetical protein
VPLAIKFCNILGLHASVAVGAHCYCSSPNGEQPRLKRTDQLKIKKELASRSSERGRGREARGAVARIVNKGRDSKYFAGHMAGINLSGRRHRVQLIACTSIIEALHTPFQLLMDAHRDHRLRLPRARSAKLIGKLIVTNVWLL